MTHKYSNLVRGRPLSLTATQRGTASLTACHTTDCIHSKLLFRSSASQPAWWAGCWLGGWFAWTLFHSYTGQY
mgnify:CR=1 FL=1